MKIGIHSLGLIGGSLLKALHDKGHKITAVTRNENAITEAKKYTPFVGSDINTLKDCEVVFVCSPMNKTLEILDSLESILSSDAIVTDVCSLKAFVMQKKRPYVFIGSHPMAGTEKNGFDASFAELFEGAKWVITPFKETQKQDIEKLEDIISLTRASILQTNAEEHDKAAALISHMPMLAAQALMKTVKDNDLALSLASSGFRDMTRLALSNTQMAEDMIKMNSRNISDALISFTENAKNLLTDDYKEQIEKLKIQRNSLYNSDGKNIYN